jgi:hypothetical protein
MNNGEAYAIFKQIYSDKYTSDEKREAIQRVLEMETHNGITKDELLAAFRWYRDDVECYLTERDMAEEQAIEICKDNTELQAEADTLRQQVITHQSQVAQLALEQERLRERLKEVRLEICGHCPKGEIIDGITHYPCDNCEWRWRGEGDEL